MEWEETAVEASGFGAQRSTGHSSLRFSFEDKHALVSCHSQPTGRQSQFLRGYSFRLAVANPALPHPSSLDAARVRECGMVPDAFHLALCIRVCESLEDTLLPVSTCISQVRSEIHDSAEVTGPFSKMSGASRL